MRMISTKATLLSASARRASSTSSERTSTTVIGFAPAENPVIAFSAIIEDGKNAKYLVRKIIDCYNKHYGNEIK